MEKRTKQENVRMIVGLGLLTAIVIVLQALAIAIRFGVFNITFCLVPIIVGAALYGWKAGAWLGFVFGVVVLLTDAGAFLAVNVPGTIATCILKGALAGAVAGIVYRAAAKKNEVAAVIAAGVASPIVNTGVFLIGTFIFFLDTVKEWAGGTDVGTYILTAFVGLNFPVELAINLALSSGIVAIVKLGRKTLANKA